MDQWYANIHRSNQSETSPRQPIPSRTSKMPAWNTKSQESDNVHIQTHRPRLILTCSPASTPWWNAHTTLRGHHPPVPNSNPSFELDLHLERHNGALDPINNSSTSLTTTWGFLPVLLRPRANSCSALEELQLFADAYYSLTHPALEHLTCIPRS